MAREQEPGGMDLLILHLLAERDMYGYEMVTELASRSNEVFRLKEGTLYPLLHRLEKEGSVSAYEEKKEGRVRRYYRLTRKGGEKLRERTEAWETYSGAVNAVLCRTPG
ncbi:MAG: helix-turn-helix transcriptional regulator [Oscillospiraceae bacterium]|nr:helix-turn-helix transcriptional regulator [Oscillospiraceae bacterium]